MLDKERFNENLISYLQEIDGNLNEHNFDESILATMVTTNRTDDALAAKAYRQLRAQAAPTSFLNPVKYSPDWTNVPGSLRSFSTPAGKLWVIISFQYVSTGLLSSSDRRVPGAVFSISVDGAPQMSSLLGAGDVSNEYTIGETDATPDIDYDSSPSIRALFSPHQVCGTFEVSAGQHAVQLCCRNLVTSSSPTAGTEFQSFTSVEVITIWMHA